MRRITGLTFVFLLLLFMIGCDGETRHDVTTGEDGSLEGMLLTPEPQSLGIDTGDTFRLDWISGYVPPAKFEVKLESLADDGTRTGVLTELYTESSTHYRLEPNSLSGNTFLLLSVTAPGEQVRAMYLTENNGSVYQAPMKKGTVEHVVTTSPDNAK